MDTVDARAAASIEARSPSAGEPSRSDHAAKSVRGPVHRIDVHAHEPETIYVVPIKSDSEHYPPGGRRRVYRSRTGGAEWEPLTNGLPQRHCYVNVLRDAMAVDALDPCGVYVGTTGGQVCVSADAGDHWAPIVRDLPSVVAVEAQTLP